MMRTARSPASRPAGWPRESPIAVSSDGRVATLLRPDVRGAVNDSPSGADGLPAVFAT